MNSKKKILVAFLSVTMTIAFAGCSAEKPEPVSEQKLSPQEPEPVMTALEADEEDSSVTAAEDEGSGDAIATVRFTVTYEDGNPDVIEVLDIDGVDGQPDETGSIITGYDEAGKPVIKKRYTG